MFFDLLVWWYLKGWLQVWQKIPSSIDRVQKEFTLPELLATLFSPWKQVVSTGGKSVDEKLRALVDNLVSRTVGFVARLVVLIVALVLIIVTAVLSLVAAIVWPAIPLL